MTDNNILLDSPIFVIGAGRSGTTMIRNTLMQHRDVAGFEYEMNYLWRYGNEKLAHDILSTEKHLNGKIKAHIRATFVQEVVKQEKSRVLDKTVANVMRPQFIQSVFPDAKILHVIRDGRAVAASAMKRWSTPQPASYFASKIRTVPFRSLPSVGFRYVINKFKSGLRNRNYRQSWGARWPGIDQAVLDLPLAQVCGRQWAESVKAALSQKNDLKPDSYMEIRYEDLVQDPGKYFENLRLFFGLAEDDKFQIWVDSMIDAGRCNKWQKNLSDEELKLVLSETSPLLNTLGYL